jgi:two-component system, OmpR family, osmolarity sensor histidine kinase EnvZ
MFSRAHDPAGPLRRAQPEARSAQGGPVTPRGPRSLLWRLGALALAVTVVSLVLHVGLITLWMKPIGEGLLAQLASRTLVTHTLLQAAPAAERDALAQRLGDNEYRVLRGAVAGLPLYSPPLLPPIGEILSARLGPGYRVLREPDDGVTFGPVRVRVAFAVDSEPWYAQVVARPPTLALLGTGIGWLALAAAAVGASLFIGLRFIVQPIRRVAERIADQGAAMQPLAEPARASIEVRSMVDSFNRLAERVHVADRTKQHLLAGVSHDLRTPLARLRLRIETQCEPAVAEAAESELRAVEHIVSQFLAYVHGDSAKAVAAGASLLGTIDEVVASYAEHGVYIVLRAAATDTQMPVVETQRLLTNLIDNALAHGEPPIEIGWRDSAPGERELSVWDHGPGLTDQQFKRALGPFVRLSDDAGIGHCGLGLAIVARIAQQWQARLECRRERPSRFGITVTWRPRDAGA